MANRMSSADITKACKRAKELIDGGMGQGAACDEVGINARTYRKRQEPGSAKRRQVAARIDSFEAVEIEPPIPDAEYRDILAFHGETPESVPYYHQLLSKETLERHLTRFQPADGARSASK